MRMSSKAKRLIKEVVMVNQPRNLHGFTKITGKSQSSHAGDAKLI